MTNAHSPWMPTSHDGTWSFPLRLHMLSDWGVGIGAGRRGEIDRLIQRDADNLPMVPGKTLTGIWRDACEVLAAALDGDRGAGFANMVELLFGTQPNLRQTDPGIAQHRSPQQALLQVRGASLPASLTRRLRLKPMRVFRDALTVIKPELAIDKDTGTAKARHLRFSELACGGGLELTADCFLDLSVYDESLRRAAWALLAAGAQFVERLGGKRRRGQGRCQLELVPTEALMAALDWLATTDAPPLARTTIADLGGTAIEPAKPETRPADWQFFDLLLELEDPVSVPARMIGNLGLGLDFIPGTLLLPRVAKAIATAGLDSTAAIASGKARVLSATLQVDRQRGLPVPFHLAKPKEDEPTNHHLSNRLVDRAMNGVQLEALRQGYLAWWPGTEDAVGQPRLGKVPLEVWTHSHVDDQLQRPVVGATGSVYSYQAIPAGTRLIARIQMSDDLFLRLRDTGWRQCLGAPILLGRSKKDTYGRARIEVSAGHPSPAPPLAPDGRLYVWCTSDTIVCDDALTATPTLEGLRSALEGAFRETGAGEIRLELVRERDGLLSAAIRQRRIESWQARWGLPRPTLATIQAGSVAIFSVAPGSATPTSEQLAAVERYGLGERRAEGFGEVLLNHPLLVESLTGTVLESDDENSARDKETTLAPISSTEVSFSIAQIIETTAWRRAIERSALLLASEESWRRKHLGWKTDSPPMSQLGGVVQALDREASSAKGLRRWLAALREQLNRSDRWPDGSLGKLATLATLGPMGADSKAGLWQALEDDHFPGARLRAPPPLTEGGDARCRGELADFALRATVKAAITAHKRMLNRRRRAMSSLEGQAR